MGTVTASVSGPSKPDEPLVEPRRGLRLGRYELLHRIASGGMAQVWAARQRGDFGFKRTCAVKVIRPELAGSREFRAMFLDEARLAARIHHPNVVEVLDLGEDGPIVYQVMELVEGDSLAGLMRRNADEQERLDPAMVARILSDMLAGLHAAHELRGDDGAPLNLVHRDVSPHNILVSIEGIAKIADFGVAKALGRIAEETDAGQLKGKFGYLSPEQATRKPIDRRSDVFSAGIVLWEALTGARLFRGDDPLHTLGRVLDGEILDPRKLVPEIPEALALVTMRALDRNPERRYSSADAFNDAIERAVQADGIVMSTRQLAAAIASRRGPSIGAQREAIEQAATAIVVEDGTVGATTAESITPSVPGRNRKRSVLLFFGALLGVGLASSIHFLDRPTATAAASSVTASSPPLLNDVPTPAMSASALPPSTAARSSTPIAIPTPPPKHRARTTTKPSPANVKLPFGNPY